MKDVKVLGMGCAKCKAALTLIEDVAKAEGVEIRLTKVEDPSAIAGYGVLSTPGVVVNGVVVHSGGLPARDKVVSWLTAA